LELKLGISGNLGKYQANPRTLKSSRGKGIEWASPDPMILGGA
jgi:hypothetical protein